MPAPENGGTFSDRHTIVFHRTLNAPLGRAWQALTTKADLDQWFMVTEIDLRTGGRYSFERGWDGWIGDLEPMRCIQFNTSDNSYTRFEIEPDGNGKTRLTLTDRLKSDLAVPPHIGAEGGVDAETSRYQPGGPGTHWAGAASGWHCFADGIVAHLDGRPLLIDFPALCHGYAEYLSERWSEPSAGR
ncbi:MAG: SRPBCC domain-containing protein [Deltaproteobacteria bacterium]|nr:SRPBCC domain-containing protein [Deltaproteobacteria bacterium]MBW2414830.1 SRPBCC domain-containing protein [Deltaproteobacteria bacterium]